MTATAIEVELLSKQYVLGEDLEGRSLRDALASVVRSRRRGPARPETIWPLRDVSFTVGEGEALGIVGRNGAGKSTLLRILSRITEPTSGVCRTRGRIGSLLEVGAGFHPELTGRENVYLNGAIQGLRAREIRRNFDEIVDFAGVQRFIDTPLKRYSSGMYLRLAFAVAAHMETEILLVDEVLAVGDAEFQRKCLGSVLTMERAGRTVVFVSHDLDAVARLCPHTIWLDEGQIRAEGPTPRVIDEYLASGIVRRGRRTFHRGAGPPAQVELQGLEVLDDELQPADALRRDRPFSIEVVYSLPEAVPGFDLAVAISNLYGTRVIEESFSSDPDSDTRSGPGQYRARITVPPLLRAGDYAVSLWMGSAYDDNLVWEENALTFRLEGDPGDRSSRLVDLGLRWDVVKSSLPPAEHPD